MATKRQRSATQLSIPILWVQTPKYYYTHTRPLPLKHRYARSPSSQYSHTYPASPKNSHTRPLPPKHRYARSPSSQYSHTHPPSPKYIHTRQMPLKHSYTRSHSAKSSIDHVLVNRKAIASEDNLSVMHNMTIWSTSDILSLQRKTNQESPQAPRQLTSQRQTDPRIKNSSPARREGEKKGPTNCWCQGCQRGCSLRSNVQPLQEDAW